MIEKEISKNLREMGPKKKKKKPQPKAEERLAPTQRVAKKTNRSKTLIRRYPNGFELKPYPNKF